MSKPYRPPWLKARDEYPQYIQDQLTGPDDAGYGWRCTRCGSTGKDYTTAEYALSAADQHEIRMHPQQRKG